MHNGFVIEGAAELEAKLQTLALKLQKRVISTAVRKGQKVLVREAQMRARALPYSTRRRGAVRALLAKNIVIKAPQKKRPGLYTLHVQMRSGVPEFVGMAIGAHTKVNFSYVDKHGATRQKIGATVGQSYLPFAIEFGHGSTKEAAARPFMRPAAQVTAQERMRVLRRELSSGILREAMKARSA